MKNGLINEGKRGLHCVNARCSKGCLVNTFIKEMIRMFLDGNILDPGKMLFDNNPLSLVCSLVSPHEKQCEGNCVLGIKGNPVNISSIENYISDYYLYLIKPNYNKILGKKVAIIGLDQQE